jgi:putative membrane protein
MSPVDPAKFKTVDEISVELSSRRTGMSFQRTRMSADRTLMSVIRTSLSLISFGFTIFQVFTNWLKNPDAPLAREAPRNFGIALVMVGILLLMAGIAYHVRYMRELREERTQMIADGLIHGQSEYPISLTLICAVVLLAIGLLAVASMVFDVRPFG